MKRREFITLLGCAVVGWPLAARAQQPKVWRIGVLALVPPTPAMLSAFRDGMRKPKRVGVVHNPNNPGVTMALRETEDAVRKLHMQVQVVNAQTSDEFERAFAQLSAESVGGVLVIADPTFIEQGRRIAELAQSARLPTAFQRHENVDAGGLLSYGPDLNNQFRQATFYVDRILKGETPAELPVMQPTKVELVINLKTAKALGLTVPLIMQMTADEVIE